MSKAGVEQVTYGPFAISCYYFGMTLLDGGSINDSLDEVREKFLRTWKVFIVKSFNYIINVTNYSAIEKTPSTLHFQKMIFKNNPYDLHIDGFYRINIYWEKQT